MRDPNTIPSVEIDNGDRIQIIPMDDIPKFDIEDYDLFDDKDFKKYITSIEKICRGSFEYRAMINYFRENVNMNKCSFYQNVNNVDTFKIKIHIHHEPFTLFDIVNIVYNKRLFHRECLDENMVAKEVMFLHYNLLVGLIPLGETVHELVHNNYLFVPLDKVMGRVMKFIELYENYMSSEQKDLLERNIEYTKSYNEDRAKNLNLLDKKYIYLDFSGAYDIPSLQSVVDNMNDRIRQLREKPNTSEESPKKPLIKAMTRTSK